MGLQIRQKLSSLGSIFACQTPQVRQAHSAVTQKSRVIDEGKVNLPAAFMTFAGGQLLFPGLLRLQWHDCLP